MKKRIAASIAIVLALTLSLIAFADDPWLINQGETVDRDAFLAGDLVQNLGTVNGDLFITGNSLSNLGNVTGDILMAGNTCNISGIVEGDIRTAGNVLTINGIVKKNASLAGNSITIGNTGVIEGSVSAAAANIIINGKIGRDFRGGADSIAINGEISRDVEIESRILTFGPNAKIGGNLTYASDSPIEIPEGIVVGEIVFKKVEEPVKDLEDDFKKNVGRIWFAGKLFGLVSYLLVGILAVYLFKQPFITASDTVSQRPWASLGIGFIGLIMIPIALIVIMITVIGIPLAMVVWALYFIALYIARLPVAFWLGRKIIRSEQRTILQMLLGILILGLLALIPYVGGWISFVVMLFGLGSIMFWIKGNIRKQKAPVEIETEIVTE